MYLFGRYILGVEPVKPGYAEYSVKPSLGGLEWIEGVVPTPFGDIRLSVRDGVATATGPRQGVGTLFWHGKMAKIAYGETVTLK